MTRFLLDPSPIITYPCQFSVSCSADLIDVTLACEDADSSLVEVVTFTDVFAEKQFGADL